MSRPQGKFVRVDPSNPSAAAQCDRCGHWYNMRDLTWQIQWSGTKLYNTQILVCTTGNRCFDVPQEQLRTIILPPDPAPVLNARVPYFDYEEQTPRITQYSGPNEPPYGAGPAKIRCLQDGNIPRVLQYLTSS